jgi:hypothetical protein
VTRRVLAKSRVSRANFWTGVQVKSEKLPGPWYDMTPTPSENFQHLEIPEDLQNEAKEFRKVLDDAEIDEGKFNAIEEMQEMADQIALLQKTAVFLNKDVRDVTALDAAAYRLHEHEQFVSSVELDKVVLFSHETTLETFRKEVLQVASRYPGNKLPAHLQKNFDAIEASLVKRVADQEIIEVAVPEEVYQHTQKNLFPSFAGKVRSK